MTSSPRRCGAIRSAPTGSVVLGFSQGGVMAYALALRHGRASGGGGGAVDLVAPPGLSATRSASLAGLPVLVQHGTRDELIDVERGREVRRGSCGRPVPTSPTASTRWATRSVPASLRRPGGVSRMSSWSRRSCCRERARRRRSLGSGRRPCGSSRASRPGRGDERVARCRRRASGTRSPALLCSGEFGIGHRSRRSRPARRSPSRRRQSCRRTSPPSPSVAPAVSFAVVDHDLGRARGGRRDVRRALLQVVVGARQAVRTVVLELALAVAHRLRGGAGARRPGSRPMAELFTSSTDPRGACPPENVKTRGLLQLAEMRVVHRRAGRRRCPRGTPSN